jgi:hypothetical protein
LESPTSPNIVSTSAQATAAAIASCTNIRHLRGQTTSFKPVKVQMTTLVLIDLSTTGTMPDIDGSRYQRFR